MFYFVKEEIFHTVSKWNNRSRLCYYNINQIEVKMKTLKVETWFSLTLAIIVLISCLPTIQKTPELTPVTVQLAWTHIAQFAGLYAADQKGFYAEEGLDVHFIEGGANIDKITPLLDGTAQFGIIGADETIVARSQGKHLKAVAVIYRQSPIVFMSLSEKGITEPQQFVGLTIRTPANLLPSLNAMMTKLGYSSDQYTCVDIASDEKLFASGTVPVWGVYSNAMLITIENAGYKVNKIYPDDYGVHFYSDSIVTTDALISSNPDLVQKFVNASLRGWTYAIENPEEIPAIIQMYSPDSDSDLDLQKMTSSIRLVNTGVDHIGWMQSQIWTDMEQTLFEQKVITQEVDINDLFDLQFVEFLYKQ